MEGSGNIDEVDGTELEVLRLRLSPFGSVQEQGASLECNRCIKQSAMYSGGGGAYGTSPAVVLEGGSRSSTSWFSENGVSGTYCMDVLWTTTDYFAVH